MLRLSKTQDIAAEDSWDGKGDVKKLQYLVNAFAGMQFISKQTLREPTGEENLLSLMRKVPILCAGSGKTSAFEQFGLVKTLGGYAVITDGEIF